MSEILDIEIGYVTDRRGARLHLVVDGGLAHCRSGSGRITRSRKATSNDTTNVCKKCRKALRVRLVDVRNTRSRRAGYGGDLHGVIGNLSIMDACDVLIEGMLNPAERAARSALIARLRRNSHLADRAETTPKPLRPMATSPESDDNLTLF